jgi:signal transduction histidine kinase
MLASFIGANRDAIVARARARVAARMSPKPTEFELSSGIPTFVEQLREALQIAESSDVLDHTAINASAERHGGEMMKRGLTIGQVVHDYGDVCQTVTSLVVELAAPITGEEFRTLNLCLDDAIAGAVTEYSRLREQASKDLGTERLGILAHEMRNLLSTAILSFDIIKSGQVGATGSTATVHRRSLLGLRDLIDRSLADVRLEAGVQHPEVIRVGELFAEIEIGAHIQAEGRAIRLTIGDVEGGLKIFGDRQILAAAISNLLQNAFKFSKRNGHVSLTARQTADRIFIDVEDECGGLPPGKAEDLFRPYEQRGTDLTGVGLGLSIVSKAAKASSGSVSVRNLPGKGCVFTLELPRLP